MESEGEAFSWGVYEKYDIASWINYLDANTTGSKYIIYGEGVGANTALFAALGQLLPESVQAIVAESPYGSLHELAARNIFKWYAVTSFPFLNAVEFKVNSSDNGFKVGDTSLKDAVNDAKESAIPVLFLCSDGDDFIPNDYTKELYSNYPSSQKDIITGTGSHGTVFCEKSEEILDWISNTLGSS